MKTLLAAAGAAAISTAAPAASDPTLKLYALDCGTLEMVSISAFSTEGNWSGGAKLADPCFLIRHPKGDFLWDTGLNETLADKPDGERLPWGHLTMEQSLTAQLEALGLTPADIEYLALSHYHNDHSGNANLFAGSRFIAQKQEHAFMFADSTRAMPTVFAPYAALEHADTVLFDDRHDVFGDGTVVIHRALGHTPGHAILLVRLEKAGALLFSGDLYVTQRSRAEKAVPSFNHDAEATKASIAAFEALAQAERARVIIQHDMGHFQSLPKFPAYLD